MALGAYGAHQFKPEDPYFVEVHMNFHFISDVFST